MKQTNLVQFLKKDNKPKQTKYIIKNKGINFIKETFKNTNIERNCHFEKSNKNIPIITNKSNNF